jgi:[ribosomal protein S5]-alanine N-acetyltransferase
MGAYAVSRLQTQRDTAKLGYRVAQHAAGRGVAIATVQQLCQLAAARHGLRTLKAADDNIIAVKRRP